MRAKLAHEVGLRRRHRLGPGGRAASARRSGPDFLIVTPGIRLTGSATDDQERITTPDHAIAAGADYIVVGRPITQADDPEPSPRPSFTTSARRTPRAPAPADKKRNEGRTTSRCRRDT